MTTAANTLSAVQASAPSPNENGYRDLVDTVNRLEPLQRLFVFHEFEKWFQGYEEHIFDGNHTPEDARECFAKWLETIDPETVDNVAMPPPIDWERMDARMDILRAKAARLSVGNTVTLDDKPFDEAGPVGGPHVITEIEDTFIKVEGFEFWHPVERVIEAFEPEKPGREAHR